MSHMGHTNPFIMCGAHMSHARVRTLMYTNVGVGASTSPSLNGFLGYFSQQKHKKIFYIGLASN